MQNLATGFRESIASGKISSDSAHSLADKERAYDH